MKPGTRVYTKSHNDYTVVPILYLEKKVRSCSTFVTLKSFVLSHKTNTNIFAKGGSEQFFVCHHVFNGGLHVQIINNILITEMNDQLTV